MLLNRQDLLRKLTQLRPALASREIVEGSAHIHFHLNSICATNDTFAVYFPMETGVQGAVRADKLYEFVDKVTKDEIEITQDENNILLRAGRTKASMRTLDVLLSPPTPESEWELLPKDYQEAISFCQFSCGKDMNRPQSVCLHIQGNKITSVDGYRATEFVQQESWPYDFPLPAKNAIHLSRYELTHISLDDSWIHFANSETGLVVSILRISCKLYQAEKHFDPQGQTIRLPSEVVGAIEKARIMVAGDSILDLQISLTLGSGKLVCRGESGEGWIEEELDIEYEGDTLLILANPIFLLDILSRTQEMVIRKSDLFLQGPNFRHVMRKIAE